MEPSKEHPNVSEQAKQIQQWHKDPKNWKWGAVYYNPEDPRGWVRKRIEWMGWTVNFANRKGISIFLLLTVFIILMMVFLPNSK